jgi:ElaB/YqjD/DUF883 family membrane-anchored ribosome-binding protein
MKVPAGLKMAAILHPGTASPESRRNFPDVAASIVHITPIDEDEFMARKNATLADSDQIKDQVFSELQSLIEESEKLLNDSAALVGEEAETLRAQVSLKLRQARQAASNVRSAMYKRTVKRGGNDTKAVAASAAIKIEQVLAMGSKAERADPVAGLAKRGFVHHVGVHEKFKALESEETGWDPAVTPDSPNAVDAHVHGTTYLVPELCGAPAPDPLAAHGIRGFAHQGW